MTVFYSVLTGAVGGIIVVFAVAALDAAEIDDPVGAISAHGVVGIWGVMAVCFTGGSIGAQAAGVLAIAGFTYVASLITILVINSFMPIRATDMEQDTGLDLVETGVEAYPEF